jgi:hypothetical protein
MVLAALAFVIHPGREWRRTVVGRCVLELERSVEAPAKLTKPYFISYAVQERSSVVLYIASAAWSTAASSAGAA